MNAREKAFQILIEIVIEGKYSHLALKNEINDFNSKDKGLISNIVYGTIQNYEYLKYCWIAYCEKKVKYEIEILLNMCTYQLLFNDKLPAYAVINEGVEITKKRYEGKYAGFVNAVLRKVLKNGAIELVGDDDQKLSIKTSMPLWIIKMWNKQYGNEICQKLCEDSLKIPKSFVRVNTLKSSVDEILENNEFQRSLGEDNTLIYQGGNLTNLDIFKHGLVTIQDLSSQKVVSFLELKEDDEVLDMCAAPGSKTSQMSALMHNKGHITALELHEHRSELIRHTLRRLGCINCDVYTCDSTNPTILKNKTFNKILLDAPCSGYGVLKRKSDIKLRMNSEDMDELVKVQAKLLDSADYLLEDEGILVYSTCTLNKKENEIQIKNFINRHDNYEIVSEKTIFPFDFDSDGFFICKLLKKHKIASKVV